MLDAVEGTAAGSWEQARAESFDPAGAIAWSESLEHGSERMPFELPDSPERDDLLQRAAAAWLQSDLSAVLEWAKAGEDTTFKRAVIRQHIDNLLASNNPSGAAAWLERILEPVARNALVSRVGEVWGRTEGQVVHAKTGCGPECHGRFQPGRLDDFHGN